ncbi:inositol hexakisphosphate and diphosphoinositol-pentakisphosphate kinase 2-like isoform X5 [Mytilus trossulus]|uniref:inositol hexakisphosphate and diphosphoinositol-pentakisphosphate kinase 2-like isoform X5 n=1 Tax=Mytilus trossulus TaxID=6551 RepID=UPI0030043B37
MAEGWENMDVNEKADASPVEDVRPVFFMGEDILVKPGLPQNEHYLDEMKKITVGICAMSKKSNSKPMNEILTRLHKHMQLNTLLFDEDVILNSPVEEWPIVDVLISFFSAGFPLDKAIAYTNLRKPFVINDLESQYTLLDRREVYKTLIKHGIPHPRYSVLNRDKGPLSTSYTITDNEDAIEIENQVFHKPFVEKPVSAEDHNVYIYFPAAAGGGSQRLFRKIGSRSSIYSNCSYLRNKGSYIYEEFMPTDGTDVKVYTVGPDYAHAEARKSPALDGKVERDKSGKEIRYPVLLSAKDKLLARKVCLAFKQNVCGFDLLRANGQSYVCDVNGFSFVKNSTKYYDDCAKILGTMIMRAKAPQLHIPWVLGSAPEDIPVVPTTSGSMMELRCVVAVIRHGDRTPKQKMKMEVKHKRFFELFKKYDGYRTGHLKLKKPKQLQEVLDIARFLLDEHHANSDPEIAEKKVKLQQLKLVLEMYGHFSGINRKVQLKYQPYGNPKKSSSEEVFDLEIETGDSGDDIPRPPSLLLIAKWGGELTPAGKIQAEDLGKAFRTLYPGGQGQFETPGLGFLRLHSTFRHDLKIYASDEGRVQMTAAAFTKGMLAFEGELTPILVQMVKSANTNGLLDKEGESKHQHIVKSRLTQILNEDKDFSEDEIQKLAPTKNESLVKALDYIKNPRKFCEYVYAMVQELTNKVRNLKLEHRTRDLKLYNGESWELLIRRWAKLEKDFRMKDGGFEISKIPDIYDCIKYDLQHNQKTLQYERATELFKYSKALADIVIPQEYGITVEEKLHISQNLCTPLMRKIRSDIEQCVMPDPDDESTRLNSQYSKGVSSPERFVRTRLYFTSESHIHSLLNMLRFGGLCNENNDEQWEKAMNYLSATSELNYMTQIVIMMFEDPTKDPSSDERFHIELHFSPGAYTCTDKAFSFPFGSGCRTASNNSKKIIKNSHEVPMTLDEKRLEIVKNKHYDRPVSAPMVIQETEELEESDIVESKLKKNKHAHGTRSPDESTPEWDWGEDSKSTETLTSESINKSPEPLNPTFVNITKPQSRSFSAPMVIQETNEEFEESEMFDSDHLKNNSKKTTSIEPQSPDPNIPEWDWGDGSDSKKSSVSPDKDNESFEQGVTESLSKSVSQPIPIQSEQAGIDSRANLGSVYLEDVNFPKSIKSQSLEEKRSRSLEDKNPKDPRTDYFVDRQYHTMHLPTASDKLRQSFSITDYFVERQYLTVHLPIATDKHRHSFSSLFYLNPEAFKGLEDKTVREMIRAKSASFITSPAFEGFNMVPSIRALETLHHNLTMAQLSDFLRRATTKKFMNPTPIESPGGSMTFRGVGPSLPSSSNSSAGPSSPTTNSTPVDIMNKLKYYIDKVKIQRKDSSSSDMDKQRTESQTAESVTSDYDYQRSYSICSETDTSSRSQRTESLSSDMGSLRLDSDAEKSSKSLNSNNGKTSNKNSNNDLNCVVDEGSKQSKTKES